MDGTVGFGLGELVLAGAVVAGERAHELDGVAARVGSADVSVGSSGVEWSYFGAVHSVVLESW